MNYPLARDPRVKAIWSKSKTGRWFCDLPADERIRLRLAHGADAHLKRVPTAFDVNVLLLVATLPVIVDKSAAKPAVRLPSSLSSQRASSSLIFPHACAGRACRNSANIPTHL